MNVAPDFHVLAYALALTMVTGIAFGLIPALKSSRLDLNTALKAMDDDPVWVKKIDELMDAVDSYIPVPERDVDIRHGHGMAEIDQARDTIARVDDATGHDRGKMRQLRLDVDRDAVERHPAPQPHADRGDLVVADPDRRDALREGGPAGGGLAAAGSANTALAAARPGGKVPMRSSASACSSA